MVELNNLLITLMAATWIEFGTDLSASRFGKPAGDVERLRKVCPLLLTILHHHIVPTDLRIAFFHLHDRNHFSLGDLLDPLDADIMVEVQRDWRIGEGSKNV